MSLLIRNVRRVLPVVVLLVLAAPAWPAEDESVEEIVVTARLREQDLQSVPLSISAFTGAELVNRGITDLEELARFTPGLDFANSGAPDSRRPIIRGLSQSTRVGDEVNVATYVDGVYTPGFSGTTLLFEGLERVEVIKGPQSAIYGRNSFAGAINYVTRKPASELDLGVRSTLGTDDRQGISGYVTGPLLGEWLSARLDAAHDETGGTNKNAVNGDTLDNVETDYARLALRMLFGERATVDASLTWEDNDYTPAPQTVLDDFSPRRAGAPPCCSANPFELGYLRDLGPPGAGRIQGSPLIGRRVLGRVADTSDSYYQDPLAGGEREAWRGTLNIELSWRSPDLGPVKLSWLSGYQDRELTYLSDLDTTAAGTWYGSIFGIADPGPGYYQTVSGPHEDRNEFSQDLRLQSNGEGDFQWAVGLYYSDEDFRDQRIRTAQPAIVTGTGTTLGVPPPPLLDEDTIVDNTFKSVYGLFDYALSEQWSIAVEGRYTKEEKSADNLANNFPCTGASLDPDGSCPTSEPVGLLEDDFSYFTPRIILSFKPTDDWLIYALGARGAKSGGFNANLDPGSQTFVPAEQFYDPEFNWTYEIGTKFGFWEQRGQLAISGYFVDWDSQQILNFGESSNTDPIILNVGKTEVWGAELEGSLVPIDYVTLNFSYAFTNPEYKDALFKTSAGWIDCADIGIECEPSATSPTGVVSSGRMDGKQLQYTAKHTATFGAEVRRPIAEGDWEAFIRGDYLSRSKSYTDEGNIGYVPGYTTVNLRLGVQSRSWLFQGFCDNVGDDDTPVFAFPSRDFGGVPHFTAKNRDGRMCGLTIAYSYGQ